MPGLRPEPEPERNPITVQLSDEDASFLANWGNGDVSDGIRTLIAWRDDVRASRIAQSDDDAETP